jgi:outer membrane protein assembly factor BamD
MLFRIFTTLIIILNLISCSKNEKIEYDNLKEVEDPIEIYKEGLEAFNTNDFLYASEKFNEAELIFDSPKSAAKSAIMSAYSLYAINLYEQAEENLNRYLKNYPGDRNVVYAHYLLAIIHFEQIGDEKYDLKPLLRTQEKVDFFLDNYPDTEYAIDLKFKKSLLKNQFAAKELYIAKYYISVQKWIPAINRLKLIIEKYDETIFIEEALHRLVEINYHIGLENEAKKYAAVLGYNYNSSKWFERSYKVLNRDYKKILKEKKKEKKKGLFKKITEMIK